MTLLRAALLLILAVVLLSPLAGAQSPPRLALIIEQTNYTGGLSRVSLARSEADQIEKALAATGFSITRQKDLTKAALSDTLDAFRSALETAGPEAIGFVYYTGHGSQHPKSGDSYLLGTDARLNAASDLAVYGLDLKSQRDGFAAVGAQAVFLVFDACRNVPALPGFKAGIKGIGRVDAQSDMLIAYSTRLNDVAEEGVYAPVLAEELTRPGQTAEAAFSAAQRRVAKATKRKQLPWTNSELYNEICFAGCTLPASAALTATRSEDIAKAEEALAIIQKAINASLKKGDVFRDSLKDGTEGPEMVVIPAGDFSMGSSFLEQGRQLDEGMVHPVRIPRDFAVSKFEVTWEDYSRCLQAEKCAWPEGLLPFQKSTPVQGVGWPDAVAYTEFLSAETGRTYRLLSEAEWEYAARAGTTGRFSNGGEDRDLCNIANGKSRGSASTFGQNTLCDDKYPDSVAPVGSFKPNAFGLYDMHGNVAEWTTDCYDTSYTDAPANGAPRLACSSRLRVARGGHFGSPPAELRSAARIALSPAGLDASAVARLEGAVGIRIALDLE